MYNIVHSIITIGTYVIIVLSIYSSNVAYEKVEEFLLSFLSLRHVKAVKSNCMI